MSGIITSSSTMSHSARSHSASASGPLCAVVTSKYSADRRASKSFTLAGTSSTTRTRAVIAKSLAAPSGGPEEMTDRLDEFADRNWLEFGIVLEPFGHFEAGYFRQLDIHQNQIRP